MRTFAYALFLGLVFLGCGGATGGPGGTVNLVDLATVGPATVCQREVRCGYYPDQATCVAANPVDDGQLLADVQAGKSTYDGAAAATCLNGLAVSSCHSSDSTAPAACDKIVKGTVAAGGACSHDEVCVSQRCALGNCDPSANCCAGTCRAVAVTAPLGGDCSNNPCGLDGFCDAAQICAKKAAAGEPCTDLEGCGAGLTCLQTSPTSGTCSAFGQHGELCNPSGTPCDLPTDYCDPATMKCASRIAVGGACAAPDSCIQFALCSSAVDGTCVALQGPGEACTQDFDCLGSLFCNNAVCAVSAPRMICP